MKRGKCGMIGSQEQPLAEGWASLKQQQQQATLNIAYGTSTAITITAGTLASSTTAGRESTAIDNGTNKFDEALVGIEATANGTPTANTLLNVYAYGSEDGSNYTDNATGSDAALTLKTPTNLRLIGQLWWSATSNYTVKGTFAVAPAFGGTLPRKWGVVVVQNSGVALSAFSAHYTGITYTNA